MTYQDLAEDFRRQAEALTSDLRSGDDPLMQRLREVIAEKGLNPQQIVCVAGSHDYLDNYIGVIVRQDGSAIEFSLDYADVPERQARLALWEPAHPLHAERIGAARDLLEKSAE